MKMTSVMMRRFQAVCFAVVLLLLVVVVVPYVGARQEDSRSLYWNRYDVTIQEIDTTANRFVVIEDQEIVVEEGPFSFGYREIPLERLEEITKIEIYDNGALLSASCEENPGTFCVTNDEKNLYVKYYAFNPLETGQTRNIRIQYTVVGALRSYENGDELVWIALSGNTTFPIRTSTVSITVPEDLKLQAVTSSPETWTFEANENSFQWHSPSEQNEVGKFEVRVKYAHDPAMRPPAWQTTANTE